MARDTNTVTYTCTYSTKCRAETTLDKDHVLALLGICPECQALRVAKGLEMQRIAKEKR